MKEGWEIKKLGDVGTFQRGGNFLKSDFVRDGYPCIHYGQIHMRFGVVTTTHLSCIPESLALSKGKIAHKGDVIIAITSEDVAGSCKGTAWMGDYDIAIGAHAAIYHHCLNPLYVSYYLKSQYFNKQKEAYTHGFKVIEIKPSDIAKITIPIPSLSEQQRIVDILDKEFEKIDRLKSNAELNLRHSKDLFQAALKKELEPKEGWKRITLQECFDITSSKRVFQSDWKKEGIPFYRAREIVKLSKNGYVDNDLFITAEMYDAYKKKYGVPKIGDILITGVGTLGVCYLVSDEKPFYFKDGNVIWLKKNKDISSEYVVLSFLSDDVQSQVHSTQGAVVGTYTIEKAKNTVISIPKTIQEQQAIVTTLDSLNTKCKVLQDNYNKTLSLCDDLKQSLLRKAFNGEL